MSNRESLADEILRLITTKPGQRAVQLAQRLGVEKSDVNSILYGMIKELVRQDMAYRWYPVAPGKVATVTEQGNDIGGVKESRIARLGACYLDVLSHDESYNASVFARTTGGRNYVELPSFPPPSGEELESEEFTELRSELQQVLHAGSRAGEWKVPIVGYPVLADAIVSRSGSSSGIVLKPLFLFEVDPDNPEGLALIDADYPQLNREPFGRLTGAQGADVMEEILLLSAELGLTESVQPQETDELFLRLRAILMLSDRSPYTKGLEGELHAFRRMVDEEIQETALATVLDEGSPQTGAQAVKQQQVLEVIPLNTEQRQAVQSAMTQPLTVITGPPGTGKSQVVTEIVVNAIWNNQRVLVASKNNKAVDIVETRVNALSGQPALFRLGARELYQHLCDYLTSLLSASVTDAEHNALDELVRDYDSTLSRLKQIRTEQNDIVRIRNEVDELFRSAEPVRENLALSCLPRLFRRTSLRSMALCVIPRPRSFH